MSLVFDVLNVTSQFSLYRAVRVSSEERTAANLYSSRALGVPPCTVVPSAKLGNKYE